MATGGRQSNNIGKLGASAGGARTWRQARILEMQCFDALPDLLRVMLNENHLTLSSDTVLLYFQSIDRQTSYSQALRVTAAKLKDLEANEILVFSGEHKASFGYPLPHVAAQATILRYGPVGARPRHRHLRIRGFGLADDQEAA